MPALIGAGDRMVKMYCVLPEPVLKKVISKDQEIGTKYKLRWLITILNNLLFATQI